MSLLSVVALSATNIWPGTLMKQQTHETSSLHWFLLCLPFASRALGTSRLLPKVTDYHGRLLPDGDCRGRWKLGEDSFSRHPCTRAKHCRRRPHYTTRTGRCEDILGQGWNSTRTIHHGSHGSTTDRRLTSFTDEGEGSKPPQAPAQDSIEGFHCEHSTGILSTTSHGSRHPREYFLSQHG